MKYNKIRGAKQGGRQTGGAVAYLGFHFGGGFKIFLEKWGYLHGAKRHAARGEATRLLWGFGGMLRREIFLKWCNLVRFREYFAKILSKQ